jgi:FMN phosphatase YigB (HAD superfamily)
MRSDPRAVLVDVGGTLWSQPVLNPADRHRASWERRLSAVGVPEDRVAELCKQLDLAIRRAEACEYFDIWQEIREAANRAGVVGIDADRIRVACCVAARDFTSLLPGVRVLLAEFKQRGARVVITSNAIWRSEADYWSDFRSFGVGDLIDAVVSSVDVCWRKPSDRFYDIALSQAGVPAEDCLMVGNSETLDVAPAKARGMSAIRVAIEEPFPSASGADRVCSSLEEVMSASS